MGASYVLASGVPSLRWLHHGTIKACGRGGDRRSGVSTAQGMGLCRRFFIYSGAVASHLLVGDGPLRWGLPLFYLLFTVGSWALRPGDLHSARGEQSVKP